MYELVVFASNAGQMCARCSANMWWLLVEHWLYSVYCYIVLYVCGKHGCSNFSSCTSQSDKLNTRHTRGMLAQELNWWTSNKKQEEIQRKWKFGELGLSILLFFKATNANANASNVPEQKQQQIVLNKNVLNAKSGHLSGICFALHMNVQRSYRNNKHEHEH